MNICALYMNIYEIHILCNFNLNRQSYSYDYPAGKISDIIGR